MTPFDRLMAWLWDPRGMRRREQSVRLQRGHDAQNHLQEVERRAIRQIEITNRFVADHQRITDTFVTQSKRNRE